jgi:two-component system LytT family response regulator
MKIKAIIIDDEPGCISNLQYHISRYCPLIEVVATATNIQDAKKIYGSSKFDVAFLDIEIGAKNAFSLLEQLCNYKFEIIFVTAFERYALKAFKVEALDYILKPLMKDDIIACYRKIIKRYTETHSYDDITENADDQKILFKYNEKTFVIKQSDIYYLKAKGVYTEASFIYNGKFTSLIICKPIGDLIGSYNKQLFYRVHKSYLINYKRIAEVIRGDNLSLKLENGLIVPVAKRRSHEFLTFFDINK